MTTLLIGLAATISAVAAVVAAVLAGFNLYYIRLSESIKWRREALADTFVGFLTASYDHRNVCMRLMEATETGERSRLHESKQAYDSTMMQCLSRLRVLTTSESVDAAQRLHDVNHGYLERTKGADLTQSDKEQLTQAFNGARDHLVNCAKRVLAIREGPSRAARLRRRLGLILGWGRTPGAGSSLSW